MRRSLILALSLVLLFTSCDIRFLDNTYIVPDDAFGTPQKIGLRQRAAGHTDVAALDEDGTLYFVVIADPHFGRDTVDSGISRSEETMMDFLELVSMNDLTFPVLLLGDVQDAGREIDERLSLEFIERMRARDALHNTSGTPLPILFTCGNHELEKDGVEHWEKLYGDHALLTGSYEVGDSILYNINSAYRLYGGLQLDMMRKALKSEAKDYSSHLFINHIPLASSRVDQTLFQFIIGDERERNEMQQIMRSCTPSFMLSGHHHKGNILSKYSPSSMEFIFSAFHKRDVFFESQGRWYIYSIEEETGACNIYGFALDTPVETLDPADWKKEAAEHYSFILR